MPKLHIRCIAGLELAFCVAGPIEDRDTSDKRAEAGILTPQKSSKKMAYAKTAGSLATDSNQHKVLGGPSGHNVKARNSARGGLESKMRAAKALLGALAKLQGYTYARICFPFMVECSSSAIAESWSCSCFWYRPAGDKRGSKEGAPSMASLTMSSWSTTTVCEPPC